MKVIMVKVGEEPRVVEIGETLEEMQQVVGGEIEMLMPWHNDLAIICNEEGKLLGLEPNRIVKNEEGLEIDVIAGTFFICYAPIEIEDFTSVPDEYIKEYLAKFSLKESRFTYYAVL